MAGPTRRRFWMDVVTQGSNRITRVCRRGTALSALASAKELSGPGAWEVDHLYLDGWNTHLLEQASGLEALAEDTMLVLLNGLLQESMDKGAQRVFMRCPVSGPLVEAVRRIGFYPLLQESILEGNWSQGLVSQDSAEMVFRERLPQDALGLFQLFSAATPQPVREGLGFTLDQWLDAQKPGSNRQWVVSHRDRITGWAGLWRREGRNEREALVHPERPEVAGLLLEIASTQPSMCFWRVPEHQESVRLRLLDRGFREGPPVAVLVKSAAARKYSYTTEAVEAWG